MARPAGKAEAPPSITPVATVRTAFHFPGLADVQYAAWDGRAPGEQAGRMAKEGESGALPRHLQSPLPGEPLLCVPPAWARTDVPALGVGALFAPSLPALDWPIPGPAPPAVPWHSAVVPPPLEGGAPALAAAVAVAASAGSGPAVDAPALVTRLLEAFEARPVWAPAALADRLGAKGAEKTPESLAFLAPALARLAFRFATGPWAGCAVRRGYDPRADPAARAWQVVVKEGGDATVRQLCDAAEGGDEAAVAALAGEPAGACDAEAGWL